MSAVPKDEMTADEFAAWSVRQPREAGKFELIDGRVVVTMMSERLVHTRIKRRLGDALQAAARAAGLPCEAFVDGPLVRISPKRSFQPDGFLYCGDTLPDDMVEVPDPVIVFEVVSPDSGNRDHGEKVDGYFSRPGIQHYLIVDPARRAIVHHRRGSGDELIRRIYHAGAIALDPPRITIEVEAVFGTDAHDDVSRYDRQPGGPAMSEPYDAHARRDTPLALKLKARIKAKGPLLLRLFMREALEDPQFGYYRSALAIGQKGDFVTAPEMSQTFGELLGLWCAVVWQQMGSPPAFDLVELGPGRGTLLADALRASARVPGFHAAMSIVLYDINTSLRAPQKAAVKPYGLPTRWVSTWLDLVDRQFWHRPAIIIGNEYLDTLTPTFAQWQGDKVVAPCVSLDASGQLVFSTMADPLLSDEGDTGHLRRYPEGEIFEDWSVKASVLTTLNRETFAACFIDYGHTTSQAGFTLQAVHNHQFEHPLTSPGEADLSVQVDFAAIVAGMRDAGLASDGPVTQAEFLGSLGIMERASRLMAANPAKANEIETGVARLMAPNGMGTRFKVLGVRSKGLPPLPGFPTNAPR